MRTLKIRDIRRNSEISLPSHTQFNQQFCASNKGVIKTHNSIKKDHFMKSLQLLTVVWCDWLSGYFKLFGRFLYFYVNRLTIGNPQCVRDWIYLSLVVERRGSFATIVYSSYSQLGKSRYLVITLRCTDLFCSFKM